MDNTELFIKLTEKEADKLLLSIKDTVKALRPKINSEDWDYLYDLDDDDLVVGFVQEMADAPDDEWQIDFFQTENGYNFSFWESEYHVALISTNSEGQVTEVMKD